MAYKHYKRSGNNITHHKNSSYHGSYLPAVRPNPNFRLVDKPRKYSLMRGNYKQASHIGGSFAVGSGNHISSETVEKVVWSDDWSIVLWALLLVCFFLSVLDYGTNPLDMFFGDGNGNGGILNIIGDFGDSTISFMNSQINTFKSWGIIDSGNDFLNFLGNILTIIGFLVNIVVQFLILILRIVMFIITGGAVKL